MPVITNHHGWQGEWMQKYACGIGTPDLLQQKKFIYELKNSKEKYLEYSKRARQMAVTHFDRHHLASALDSLFLGCC